MKNILLTNFDGAGLKIERANCHINEFKSTLDEIVRTIPNGLAVSVQADGSRIVNFHELGPLGKTLPLIVGDCIHNLRSAFDHIWMALWRASGKPGFGTFPFHETRKNLEDTITKSPVKTTFPEVENLILNNVKPHSDAGGNNLLWAITKFDKIDKHNLIIPTIDVRTITNTIFKHGKQTIEISNVSFSGNGNPMRFGAPVEYKQKAEITIEITFPKDNLLAREPVLPTLINMSEATSETLKVFRKTFL